MTSFIPDDMGGLQGGIEHQKNKAQARAAADSLPKIKEGAPAPASQAAAPQNTAHAAIGRIIEQISELQALFPDGCQEPGALYRHHEVMAVLFAASRAALAGAAPVEAAKNEGWTANTGTQPDIDGGAMVEVELLMGNKITRQASCLDWRRDGDRGDIARWRLAGSAEHVGAGK